MLIPKLDSHPFDGLEGFGLKHFVFGMLKTPRDSLRRERFSKTPEYHSRWKSMYRSKQTCVSTTNEKHGVSAKFRHDPDMHIISCLNI